MNITTEEKQGGSLLLKITVSEADYGEAADKQLKEYRRKANVPGFRPGMVPMGIIRKMYRKGVVAETAYRTATDKAFKHLEENKIDIMGDLLPAEEQGELDFENGSEYEFIFEVGPAPKVDITPGESDKVTYYKIKADKEMREGYRSSFVRRFGRLEDVAKVTKDEAIEATLDNGQIKVDDAYIGLISLSDDERKQFKGKKVGDSMVVNVKELYKNPAQLSSILSIDQSEIENLNPEFTATINKIRQFVEPAMNEEFFTMAFPDGSVKSEEEFNKFIDSSIEKELARESDYLFSKTVREYFAGKADLTLPRDFLKRWLHAVNEGKFSMEDIEKDFDAFIGMMTWNLVRRNLAETLKVDVSSEDLLAEAKTIASAQFAQYGMASVPDDTLTSYAQRMLTEKEDAQRIYEQVLESKVVEAVKPLVKVTNKNVSMEEFRKIASETK